MKQHSIFFLASKEDVKIPFPAATNCHNFVQRRFTLSRKTVNTRENFWIVFCYATNQIKPQQLTDKPQQGSVTT